MASKLRHMLKNGIEGYFTYDIADMPAILKAVMNETRGYSAVPSSHKVSIDGRVIPLKAYNIGGDSYKML
jgi:hypothetical protein